MANADSPPAETLELHLRNQLDQVPVLCDAVEAFWADTGLPQALGFQFMLALDEIVTNIVNYGFPEGGVHEILVRIACHSGRVIAEVRDDGRPFDPREIPPPDLKASLEDRPVGGLGLHLVRTLMDSLTYQRVGGYNHLTVTLTARRGGSTAKESPESPVS